MKKILLLTPLLFFLVYSCTHEETPLTEKKIQFSFANVSSGVSEGRVGDASSVTGNLQSVMVTIKDDAGNTVVAQQALTLHRFGAGFLSLPLTLKASGTSNYRLSEFFVIDSGSQVDYATPREGSPLARLVADPLDILFTADVNNIITVTPQVLAVNDSSDAADYGYGQFGFNVVKTINAAFSGFIEGTSNFELTTAHLKIEGLNDSISKDTTGLWVYETDLGAKANTIVLKEAVSYRVTATKDGYVSWVRTLTLRDNKVVDMFFEKGDDTADVYTAGVIDLAGAGHVAAYWKNGVRVQLSAKTSFASDIFVSNGDVYVTGSETGTTRAFYWKNGSQVFLPQTGITRKIFVAGQDVHVVGESSTAPNGPSISSYWKNGALTELSAATGFSFSLFSNLVVDGMDVYATGFQAIQGVEYPAFLKNGMVTRLSCPAPYQGYAGYATGLKVDDGHVYISGTASGKSIEKAVFWKDGQPAVLASPSSVAKAQQLDVEGGDVYVAGMQNDASAGWKGTYWKDGEQFFVDAQANVNLFCVKVLNGKIYMAGDRDDHTTGDLATYWVDGNRTNCETTQDSNVYSMFVVAKQ